MTQPTPRNNWWTREIFAPEGWKAALLGSRASALEESTKQESADSAGHYPAELSGLLAIADSVRRRITLNRFLATWMVCLTWVLLALVIAGAFSSSLKYVLILAAIAAGGGMVFAFLRRWLQKPSAYYCTCEIDRASGLSDRLSTALYFGTVEKPEPMILRQRRDALRLLDQVDTSALFPIRLPAFANRTMALVVIVTGLLAYRLHYNPPMMALVHRASASRVEKAVLAPMAGAVKKELLALVSRDDSEVKEAAADAETVPGLNDAKSADDPSQAGDKNGIPPSDMDDDDSQSTTAGEQGDPTDAQAADASQGEGQDASQSPDSQNQSADNNQQSNEDNEKGATGQQAGDQAASNNSMMQALKNLMKNMTSQASASPSQANAQASAAGASQQPGNSAGQGEAKSDAPKDSQNDEKQPADPTSSKKPGGGAGNGSTPVPKQADKAGLPSAKKMVPDRVDLEADNFRQQGRIRTTSAVGNAQLPLRDIKPQPQAAIKGAEQEDIPVRYRLYVQRYFEHADKSPQ